MIVLMRGVALSFGLLAFPLQSAAEICVAWEAPSSATCESIIDMTDSTPEMRFDRDIFLSWVLEEWRVGNIQALQDLMFSSEASDAAGLPALSDRFAWLSDKSDTPIETVLWCSLETVKNTTVGLDSFVVPDLSNSSNGAALAEVRFWLGYDLLTQAARDLVGELDAQLTNSGRLAAITSDNVEMSHARRNSICLGLPWMQAALTHEDMPASPRYALIQDSADAAEHLARALEAEIAAASSDSEAHATSEETLQVAVNNQLHKEVTGNGQIENRILSQARLLSQAFAALNAEITAHARKINRLNADMMAVDRNLRTYTQVFAGHDVEIFDDRFARALTDLESVLAERQLLGQNQSMWIVDDRETADESDDILILNPENETVMLCKNNPDCGYCQLSDRLTAQNVEEHLVCFHSFSLMQAEQARNSALEPAQAELPGGDGLEWHECLQDIDPSDPVAKREVEARSCFLDWMWEIDPMVSARMEAAFARENR